MYSKNISRVSTTRVRFSTIYVPTYIEHVKPDIITNIIRAPPLITIDYNSLTKLIEQHKIARSL
jgi:hypothetical protein